MFNYYRKRLNELFKKCPHLQKIFTESIFPCAAFNFGPCVCTFKHRDILNCPFGWCGIQPLGNFDHTKGGHEILCMGVGNYLELFKLYAPYLALSWAFTQFYPDGILRYVDNKFWTEKEFFAQDPGLNILSKYE